MNNDYQMECLLNELKQFKAEKERLIEVSKQMIQDYELKIAQCNESIEAKERYVNEVIVSMLEMDQMKETKTGFNYSLPSGKVIISKESYKMKLKEGIDETNIPTRFIELKKSVKWGDYKKILKVVDGEVINIQTGEIVENVIVEKVEGGKLNIKLSD